MSTTITTTADAGLQARLDTAGIDPFAVPDDLRKYYDATSEAWAAQSIQGRGESIQERGERALEPLIIALLSAEHGYDVTAPDAVASGRGASRVALFSQHGPLTGRESAREAELRSDARRLAEDARMVGLPYRLALHVERLRDAKERKRGAELGAIIGDASRRAHTDPITGRYSVRRYGEVHTAPVVPGIHSRGDGKGAWDVRGAALTRFLIGQEVARQILAADPELAAYVAAEASRLVARNGFTPTDR